MDNKTPNNNTDLYEQLRAVPEEAKKPIQDGRLKGKTDVNAMWRIKRMTEVFGPCGIGWKYVIKEKRLEEADADNVSAFVDIDLYIRDPKTGQWSEAIPGTGGNIFKRRENSGKIYMDDDCFKKALTDAISIACKALGLAADVWFEQDVSKYEPSGTSIGSGNRKNSQTSPGNKPELTPDSPYWLNSVTRAAGINDTPDNIRKRLTAKFNITEANFMKLMMAAGKPLK